MPCPKCNSINFVRAGKYKVKRERRLIQRFRCKDCKCFFSLRTFSFHKKISLRIRKRILRLSRTRNYHKSKFDAFKKKTHSTRAIARILNVSKTYVWEVVKGRY